MAARTANSNQPQVGDRIRYPGQTYVVTRMQLFKNGNALVKIEGDYTTLTLKGKQPIRDWSHWRGIVKKSLSYTRPRKRT